MPLPPAPSKKASRLSASDIENAPKASPIAKKKPVSSSPIEYREAPLSSQAPRAAAPAPIASPPAKGVQPPVSAAAVATTIAPHQTRGNRTPSATRLTKAKRKSGQPTRLFVLDTNVLLHDPMSLFRFEEHDIYLPMVVLEELDGHKKGMSEVARNGRQTSRNLDLLLAGDVDMAKGVPLNAANHVEASGTLYFQTQSFDNETLHNLPAGKADNQILAVVQGLRKVHPDREVILVSKDINMRIKAKALGFLAEDYENDKALDDDELLYSGSLALPADFWSKQSKKVESWQQGAFTFYRVHGSIVDQFLLNQFVYFEAPQEPSLYARVTEIRDRSAVLKTLTDHGHAKNAVWGITSRNREQNFALNLLMDPEVDFVSLTGQAGTGKTLLALASGLSQVLDTRRYTEIIMTRATVSVGEDIGFLPGTEEEKMGPWMGAVDDNLEFLAKGDATGAGEWGRAATNELIRSRIKIKSLNFMRGRTFLNRFVIIDEAQNLTPKQLKTLITRAGPGTKLVVMGNLAQIDTPYLTEGASGLTFVVDRFKGWPHGGHIALARGERSRLADFASDVL
jgi:PhoH-like ATPase